LDLVDRINSALPARHPKNMKAGGKGGVIFFTQKNVIGILSANTSV